MELKNKGHTKFDEKSMFNVGTHMTTYTSYRLPCGKKPETYISSAASPRRTLCLPSTHCPIQYYLYII